MDTRRRDLIRTFAARVGAAAATTVGRTALADAPPITATSPTYDVCTYGATGDGRSVDYSAINRAIRGSSV